MKIELPSGKVVECDDTIQMDLADFAALKEIIERLERENAVLLDAATSNSVLRSNVEKSKKITKFQRNSALLFRKAARSLWKTFSIEIGQIGEDGTRPLTLTAKETGEKMELFIPAERAAYIERVFKPDGTFANREDVFALIREKDEQIRRLNCEGEEDE